ncbi:MAG: DNA-binding protein WhiA [Sellimonas sp.]|uniref:DNA-binding protein WhiA n=1 Tax=Sellimonas sp. TaxID=2021466 RepID=UPI0039A11F07
MSFSGNVKEELLGHISTARHCQIAELSSILLFCGRAKWGEGRIRTLKVQTENEAVARKCFTLLTKAFNIKAEISTRQNQEKKSVMYTISVDDCRDAARVWKAAKLSESTVETGGFSTVSGLVTQNGCCKRAFLRGAFLSAGSMSDPKKSYHFEIVCSSEEKALLLQKLMCDFEMDAKVVKRKKMFVVYLKEGAQIALMLNVMEAPVALMELENIRILKEMRNSVNRKVNCETANINKTVSAAVKQVEDISYIDEKMGLDKLSEGLEDIARTRLKYPEATLKELGELMAEPIGKSGVNHRLRRLGQIAEKLREANGVQGGTV